MRFVFMFVVCVTELFVTGCLIVLSYFMFWVFGFKVRCCFMLAFHYGMLCLLFLLCLVCFVCLVLVEEYLPFNCVRVIGVRLDGVW